jgi:ATP-dependent Clp protease adaptor protein ClpS
LAGIILAVMAEKESTTSSDNSGTATVDAPAKPKKSRKPAPKKSPPKKLPPWKVLLHNDDENSFEFVILTIVELTPLNEDEAVQRTLEADKTGLALLLTTHRERAELYKDQFTSKGLTVTIEPAD